MPSALCFFGGFERSGFYGKQSDLNLQSEICNLKSEINLSLLQPQGLKDRSSSDSAYEA